MALGYFGLLTILSVPIYRLIKLLVVSERVTAGTRRRAMSVPVHLLDQTFEPDTPPTTTSTPLKRERAHSAAPLANLREVMNKN